MTEREQPGETVESIFWKTASTLAGRFSGAGGGVWARMLDERRNENAAGTRWGDRMVGLHNEKYGWILSRQCKPASRTDVQVCGVRVRRRACTKRQSRGFLRRMVSPKSLRPERTLTSRRDKARRSGRAFRGLRRLQD